MLSCRQVAQMSGALLDGDLRYRERLAVRLHIFMCRHCRRFIRQLRHLLVFLRLRRTEQSVSDDFVDRVLNAIEGTRGSASESERNQP